jgi:response regulator of citrate/malate metabolism
MRPVCHVIRSITALRVVAATAQPQLALRTALETRPDLVIIDSACGDGIGIKLARRLRASDHAVEIVTIGAPTLDFVRASYHLGAVDIVTLPAHLDRVREALDRFLKHMAALASVQDGGPLPPMRNEGRWLPKGISRQNVELVRQVLAAEEAPATSSEVAAKVGLARVTCRRYLEYLVTIGDARASSVPAGPGRPRRVYQQLQLVGREVRQERALATA